MSINFVYPGGGYRPIIDSIVDPILEHLPEGVKTDHPGQGLNITFFTEKSQHRGCTTFISHGIADKNWRNAGRIAHLEHVLVSGPMWADKYTKQKVPKNKIHIGGYTKLDPIFQGKVTKQRDIRVLWAPTHGIMSKTSTYPRFQEYLHMIPGIESALHPVSRKDKTPTMQLLVDASVVIADCGSLIYEAWALGKPVIFPDWLIKEGIIKCFPSSFESMIFEQNIGYHARDINHLIKLVDEAKERGLDKKTQDFIDSIFPPYLRGNSGRATAEILRSIAG